MEDLAQKVLTEAMYAVVSAETVDTRNRSLIRLAKMFFDEAVCFVASRESGWTVTCADPEDSERAFEFLKKNWQAVTRLSKPLAKTEDAEFEALAFQMPMPHQILIVLSAQSIVNGRQEAFASFCLSLSVYEGIRTGRDHAVVKKDEIKMLEYAASHDMRSPLRALSGYLDLALGSSSEAEKADFLEKCRINVFRLSKMISRYTDYLSWHLKTVALEVVDVEKLIRSGFASSKFRINGGNIKILARLPFCIGDTSFLSVAFTGVFEWISSVSPDCSVVVSPVAQPFSKEEWVCCFFIPDLELTDQGIGKSFTLFPPVSTGNPQDVSQGLAEVRLLVRLSGGDLKMSRENNGMSIKFSLIKRSRIADPASE